MDKTSGTILHPTTTVQDPFGEDADEGRPQASLVLRHSTFDYVPQHVRGDILGAAGKTAPADITPAIIKGDELTGPEFPSGALGIFFHYFVRRSGTGVYAAVSSVSCTTGCSAVTVPPSNFDSLPVETNFFDVCSSFRFRVC